MEKGNWRRMGTKTYGKMKAEEERIARGRAGKNRLEELRAQEEMPPLDRQSNNDLRKDGPTAYPLSKPPTPRPGPQQTSHHDLRHLSHAIVNELRLGRWSRGVLVEEMKGPGRAMNTQHLVMCSAYQMVQDAGITPNAFRRTG